MTEKTQAELNQIRNIDVFQEELKMRLNNLKKKEEIVIEGNEGLMENSISNGSCQSRKQMVRKKLIVC